ncbi:MAG: hypothetical protein CMN34_03570, partial [Saprospirales bacterium]|nr:hypothetical protein [Saprospirales bacterium]
HDEASHKGDHAHGDDHHDEASHKGDHAHGDGHHDEEHATTYAGLGLVELFIFLGFLGSFLFVTFRALDRQDLENVEDPFLKESKHHHI